MGRTTTTQVQDAFNLTYVAAPTLAQFHASDAFVRTILGPVGSGKSVAAMVELFLLACNQPPNVDGVRQTRSLVQRDNYPALKSTSWRTFDEWFGGLGNVVFDSPIRYRAKIPLPDGTTVDWEVLFYAIDGTDESLQKLRSLEISNAFVNEGNTTTPATLSVIKSRLGRFPAKRNGVPCKRPCLIIDSNFGANDSPLKQLLEEAPVGHDFFMQPPAVYWDVQTSQWIVNEFAENRQWLPDNYYENMMQGMQVDQIRMLLANQWITPNAGKPVYPEFKTAHKFHGRIQHTPGQPVIVGMDFGLHVAAACGQLTRTGSALVLSECFDDDMDLDTFIETKLQPHVQERYPNSPIIICGDPTGKNRSSIDSRTSFSTLRDAGFMVVPAHSNDPEIRIGNVKYFLSRNNGLYVSTECPRIVEGFEGAYGYERVAVASSSNLKYKDQPAKNKHSHAADAVQYLASYLRYGRYVTDAPKGWAASRRRAATDFDARRRTGRKGVSAVGLDGLPIAQNPDQWGRKAPQVAQQGQTPMVHEYV